MRSHQQVQNVSTHNPSREAQLRAFRLLSNGSNNMHVPAQQLLDMRDPLASPMQGNRVLFSSRFRNINDSSMSAFTTTLTNTILNPYAMQVLNIDIPATGHNITQDNQILYFVEKVDTTMHFFAAYLPVGNFTASDLADVIAISMQNAQCVNYPGTLPQNTYVCTYEDGYTNTIRITADVNDFFNILSPVTPPAQPILSVTKVNDRTVSITTALKAHGIGKGDIIETLSIRNEEGTFIIRNLQILSSDSCDPNSSTFTVTNPNANYVWPFTSTVASAQTSSMQTKSMRNNIGPTIGYALSTTTTFIPVLHFTNRSGTRTLVTALPHGLETGDQADVYVGSTRVLTITVQASSNQFHLSTTSSLTLTDVQNVPEGNVTLVTKSRMAPNKIDLTSQNRTVLIRCLLNGTTEVGSIFVPSSPTRFLARVQISSAPNTMQYVQESLHSMGVFELPHPIKQLYNVRLELYNENGLTLYDTNGVHWSCVLEFMCDNNGN